MKNHRHRYIFRTSKDVIALVMIIIWGVSVFLPETFVNETAARQIERLLLMVVGFYFGSHKEDPDAPKLSERINNIRQSQSSEDSNNNQREVE